MTTRPTRILTRTLAAGLLLLTMIAISTTAHASTPDRNPGGIGYRSTDTSFADNAWQDPTGWFDTSRNLFQSTYINGLERRHGTQLRVTRTNLLNSPATEYFIKLLTGRRSR